MSDIENGGPAFPHDTSARFCERSGMTLRQYAAIKLRVPNSGTDWLDEMIRQSLRNEFAAKAMPAVIANKQAIFTDELESPAIDFLEICPHRCNDSDVIADAAYAVADAMLRARAE